MEMKLKLEVQLQFRCWPGQAILNGFVRRAPPVFVAVFVQIS